MPKTMMVSAMLKEGQCQLCMVHSIKSITPPYRNRSIMFEVAPEITSSFPKVAEEKVEE